MRTVTDVSGARPDAPADQLLARIVEAPAQGVVNWRLPVEDGLVLGRSPGTGGITIADPRVSGTHIRFRVRPGYVTFEDMESKNGVFHNGFRSKGAAVEQGDVLRFGSTMLVLTLKGAAEAYEDTDAGLIGDAPAFRSATARVRQAARSDVPVLLLGETGTGKEVMARLVHVQSGRQGPFLACNCAAIAPQLADSTLFGHERGAFTGATAARLGFFREADGGTLFLDELGDLPLDIQPRLLRALELGEILPVGSARPVFVRTRVVAATNVDLEQAVAEGRFRADLHARLFAWPVTLPALRERREDVLRIARFFGGRDPQTMTHDAPLFEPDAAEALMLHDWLYNIRELRQVMGALSVASEPPFGLDDLPESFAETLQQARRGPTPAVVHGARRATSPERPRTEPPRRRTRPPREELERVLASHQFNVSAVARHFDRDRKQIYRWLRHYSIELPDVG